MRLGNIHWRTALVFGPPSIVAVYLTRAFIVPALPDPLFTIGRYGSLQVTWDARPLRAAHDRRSIQHDPEAEGTASSETATAVKFNYPLILAEGLLVGVITGLVGAGGGFLIIPALVLLAKLPMKLAVGTSLVIIAAKSLIGFTGDLNGARSIDWNFLLVFSVIAVVGIHCR